MYLKYVVIAIDQLFNALAGGHPDETISARLGFLYSRRKSKWTTLLMHVVDMAFYPIDGPRHCLQAYALNLNGRYIRGNTYALAALSVFVVAGCMLLFPINLALGVVRFIKK